jgi:hypothetical protein
MVIHYFIFTGVLIFTFFIIVYLLAGAPPRKHKAASTPGKPLLDGSAKSSKPLLDHIAWASFGIGIFLMFLISLAAVEGDGHFRSWETIRSQTRALWVLAAITVGVPTLIVLYQALGSFFARSFRGKKPPLDEL